MWTHEHVDTQTHMYTRIHTQVHTVTQAHCFALKYIHMESRE